MNFFLSDCTNRFTHANRHCALHPKAGVKRDQKTVAINQSRPKLLKKSDSPVSSEEHTESSSTVCVDLSRKRKLPQSSVPDVDLGMLVWKKKRAALELRQSAQNESSSNQLVLDSGAGSSGILTSKKTQVTSNEQLMGALALMELATQIPIEASSEIDVIGSEQSIEPFDFFASSQGEFSVTGGDKFGTSMSLYSQHQATYDESFFFS